ncbi:MAG: T9SS type A sorting domain-containing protein [Calditrichaceae bacterium]|nr:T9SS type A sorting domain-containing protein [Calditrichaceae bacterium]RQV96574.1 MAG: T9SS C-terminal target domain-containing protein [Calditrichota bacterium]
MCRTKIWIVFLAISFAFTHGQVIWEKYEANPIGFTTGEAGSWDSWRAFITSIMFYDGLYKAWYDGYDEEGICRIGFATSVDGIEWSKHENPVLWSGEEGSWDDEYVGNCSVVLIDTVFHMWYTGEDGQHYRIGYATSPDGITWTKFHANPVVEFGYEGMWDEGEVMHPMVLYDGDSLRMWYNGYGQGLQRTGYATSKNGIYWYKHSKNPVLSLGPEGAWVDYQLIMMSVLYEDGEYKMWFTAGDGTYDDRMYYRIGYAGSSDGVNWSKYHGNPVLDMGGPDSWDCANVVISSVLYDSAAQLYKMWYGGSNEITGGMGLATAPDSIPPSGILNGQQMICKTFTLNQNYPNPFNASTKISYELPVTCHVCVTIFNCLGQKITELFSGHQQPGRHMVKWNAATYPSGIYVCRMQTDKGFTQTKKLILLK